jgi:hypothetical protein
MTKKDDFENKLFVANLFPIGQFPEAIKELQKDKFFIDVFANGTFVRHASLFNKIGLDGEDIAALYQIYAYSYFLTKEPTLLLVEFLMQKQQYLVKLCQLKAEGMVEEYAMVNLNILQAGHNETPEAILIANQSVALYKAIPTHSISRDLH